MTPKPLEELDESLKRRAAQIIWLRDVRREEMRPEIKAATGDSAAILRRLPMRARGWRSWRSVAEG